MILGASKRAQLEENLAALEVVPRLTEGVRERIEAVLGNKPELPQQF